MDVAKTQLLLAEDYDEWQIVAFKLDTLTGSDSWRQNFTSKKYDFKLISERVAQFKAARQNGDIDMLLKLFRTGSFLRNFGGIANRQLFNRSYTGTKILIEDYVTELLHCLEYIESAEVHDNELSSNQLKLDFFHDARQAFGSTALVLQGGSLFGLCHLGVVKAMYFKGLLPRIISGSAIGAVVAAFVCSLTDDELAHNLTHITESLSRIDRLNTDVDERYGSVIENVVKKGYSQDILVFMKYVKDHLGDMTFEEAYVRTDKILSIIVHPTDAAVPSLLNYVTTPNMVIWSAVYASIGAGVLSDNVLLYIKNMDGDIAPAEFHGHSNCTFLTPQKANERFGEESPYTRVTELFNVNNFIVSLARPYLAPLIVNDIKHNTGWRPFRVLQRLFAMELQHRVELMDRIGMLSSFIKRLAVDEKTPKNASEVTIVPELRTLVKDFWRVFDVHRTMENIPYWILVGERSVWPVVPILWTRCAVEFTLDNLYDNRRRRKL